MKKAIIGATIATLGAACAIGIARGVQRKRIDRDVDELFAAMTDEQPPVITEADLAEQPEPVGRWLRYSGVVGKPMPRAVRLKQQGEFRLEGRGWMPFEAEEYYTTNPPGFVWVVAMRMLPLVSITGRDQYRDGEGSMKMRLSSLIPVVNERGGMLNQGAMLRFLNEIMWFPAAALSPYISWQANDENSAIATMTYGGVTAPATFSFDDEGRLIDMVAERYNDARDGMQIWSTPITGYGEFGGVRIPIGGVGVWKYGSGDFPYVRLCITDVEYDVAERY
jgi:hypothetical protein